jgi:hypothetical protein
MPMRFYTLLLAVRGCLTALQVAALVFGDESASLSQPVGYRGEHTLSMRSTKVR